MRYVIEALREELRKPHSDLRMGFLASIRSALDDARACADKIDNETLAVMILERITGE